jgi:outer membrane protein TolC
MIVETVRSVTAQLETNVGIAKSALALLMGLDPKTEIEIQDTELPEINWEIYYHQMVDASYRFNPDWFKLQAALKALEAKIKESKSYARPKIAFTGSLNFMINAYDAGMVSPQNKTMWMVGLGLEIPVFMGFRNKYQVQESLFRLQKIEKAQIFLKDGIALQIDHLVRKIQGNLSQKKSTYEAQRAAEENRDLTERAYQNELIEMEEVIVSQILEAFMKAQYKKILYDHLELIARLEFTIGEEVIKIMEIQT